MSFIWRLLWLPTRNFASIYIFQVLLYWLFMAGISWSLPLRSPGFWLLLLIAVFLSFIPQYVMRDTLLVLFWGIAVVWISRVAQRSHSRKTAVACLALLLLCLGFWCRSNAVIGMIPLIAAWFAGLGQKEISGRKLLIIAVLGTAVIFCSFRIINSRVMHSAKEYPGYKLKLQDLTGMSKLAEKNLVPPCAQGPGFNYPELMAGYTPASLDHIYWPMDNKAPQFLMPDADRAACVHRNWLAALKRYPLLYLQNRADGFWYYLRIRKRFKPEEYWNTPIQIEQNEFNVKQEPRRLRDLAERGYRALYRSCIFDPWFWLLLNLVACIYFGIRYLRSRDTGMLISMLIQLSGIVFILSQFPVYQFDRDLRYSYWNIIVAVIALATVLRGKKSIKT